MLSKHPDACRFPHGHSRTIEIVLRAESLDGRDMVCDFKALKEAMTLAVRRYDHAMAMNTEDPSFEVFRRLQGEHILAFEGQDPTTEVIAKQLFDAAVEALKQAVAQATATAYPIDRGVCVERVRVSETPSTWAEYGI